MEEYILFLDETKTTSNNPYFCLGGYITTREYYEDTIIKSIEKLKGDNSIGSKIPLHYTDIKNGNGNYSYLRAEHGKHLRTKLMVDIVNLIKQLNIIVMGDYCNKKSLNNILSKNITIDIYAILLYEIMEQYMFFLIEHNAHGSIYVESRTFNEDSILQKVFYNYRENGSPLFSRNIVQKHLKTMTFLIKKEVCYGIELADFIPISLTRDINNAKDSYNISSAVLSKLYKRDTEYEKMVGLKNYMHI